MLPLGGACTPVIESPLRRPAQLFNTHIPALQALCFLLDRAASAVLPNWLYTAHQRNTM
jgi:hypothetical protein